MKYFVLCAFLYLQQLSAQPEDYNAYSTFLQKYVSATGKVNYKDIQKNKIELEQILKTFAAQTPQKGWDKNTQLAYWINVYNAFTIKLIVDNYPVKKITDLDKGKPWDVKRIELAGQKYSLNQIENDIIRPQFNDARIHFALNCAAKSCPPLLNRAFSPSTLQIQLESQTKKFVTLNANSFTKSSAKISKIFEWYAKDFVNLTNFLNKYNTTKLDKNARIEYIDYNWALNE